MMQDSHLKGSKLAISGHCHSRYVVVVAAARIETNVGNDIPFSLLMPRLSFLDIYLCCSLKDPELDASLLTSNNS